MKNLLLVIIFFTSSITLAQRIESEDTVRVNKDDPNLNAGDEFHDRRGYLEEWYDFFNEKWHDSEFPWAHDNDPNPTGTEGGVCQDCQDNKNPPPATMKERIERLPEGSHTRLFTDQCVFPVPVVSGFNMRSCAGMRRHPRLGVRRLHEGTDVSVPRGTPIFASSDGCVALNVTTGGTPSNSFGWNAFFSTDEAIPNQTQYSMMYAHLQPPRNCSSLNDLRLRTIDDQETSCLVSRDPETKGVRVRAGEVLGCTGNTGLSTGPHLHFELRRWGYMPKVNSVFNERDAGVIWQPFKEVCNFSDIIDELPGSRTRCNIPRSEWAR